MSRSSRSVLRRPLLGAGAALAVATAGLAAAPGAQAAFTLTKCGATSPSAAFKGQGSSFQTAAQAYFANVFASSNGCNGATPNPAAYNPNGSGSGNASMGAGQGSQASPSTVNCAPGCLDNGVFAAGRRDTTTRFAGSDEAPDATKLASMNNGPDLTAGTSDDGKLHVIPVALGAATVILHVPDGCDVGTNTTGTVGGVAPLGTTDGVSGDSAATFTARVRLSNQTIERIFAGDTAYRTWGQVIPTITGTVTAGVSPDGGNSCANAPIKRVVRRDESGTTFTFKTFLDKINPSRGWLTTYQGAKNSWPKGNGDATAITAPANAGNAVACTNSTDQICTSGGNGGGNLRDTSFVTSGSIGYVALSDARSGNKFEVAPANSLATADTTYWIPLQDLRTSGATFHEPTTDATAHKPGVGAKGSDCDTAPISGVPTGTDPTFGDWSKTTAVGTDSFNGYPACVLTYELAWDDNAPVYGNTSAEEQNARAVKDFLGVMVSSFGQKFTNTDYSALPSTLLTVAQNGVSAIDWNKTATSGGGGNTGGNTPPATTPPATTPPATTPPATTPPVTTVPSNAFTLGSSSSKSTGLTFKLTLPGAGTVLAKATAKVGKKTITVGTVSAKPTGAGTVTLTIKLSSKAKAALKKAKGKKLSVKTVITFTPNGGTAKSVTKSLTVKAAK